MFQNHPVVRPTRILLTVALAAPGVVFAYGSEDAIRDCEERIRSEYNLTDLRDADATQLEGEKHFKVVGKAKVDGDKYPWTCEVKNRHVITAEYHGRKPKGMSTGEKLAVGAAAAVAIGVAANQMNKHQDDTSYEDSASRGATGSSGARGLQDLVGARGSSGEAELESRGYEFVSTQKEAGSSYSAWRKGSHCIMVRTANGRYDSISDAPMADCQGGSRHQSEGHAGHGGAGAAGLQDLVGAKASSGEAEMERRGYEFISTEKGGGSSYSTWLEGSHCVTARTVNGRYASIVDVTMADCK